MVVSCQQEEKHHAKYTCPMHPQIIKDAPGQCPICGMDLVELIDNEISAISDSSQPIENQSDSSTIVSIKIQKATLPIAVEVEGYVAYNPKGTKDISSRFGGRIEKLYVKYNFQSIKKGQKLMEIYSPEMATAQENLLLLLKTDAENEMAIAGAKKQLELLGMDEKQLEILISSRKSSPLMSVYAAESGHIHEMTNISELTMPIMEMAQDEQKEENSTKEEKSFSIKEGMYVEKGQMLFSIIETEVLWVILKIRPEDLEKVKLYQSVTIFSEIQSEMTYSGKIDFIEPAFENDSKFLNARVYLQNTDHHQLKIGSLIKANINAGSKTAMWLPKAAVLDLGNDKHVVFVKQENDFVTRKIEVGIKIEDNVEIRSGLSEKDQIARNAQYMVDSEGFVK